MTNAELFVSAHAALDILNERRRMFSQEIAERRKRVMKTTNAITAALHKVGPDVLAQESTVSPEDRALIGNPLRGL